METSKIIKIVVIFVALTFITVFSGKIILASADKIEIQECLTWQKQSAEHPDYYITKWQKGQCDAHQIIINSPVK
jgi:ssDNA-specific exonuclease RecJ